MTKTHGAIVVQMVCTYNGRTYKGVGTAKSDDEARKIAAADLLKILPAECTSPNIKVTTTGGQPESASPQGGLWSE